MGAENFQEFRGKRAFKRSRVLLAGSLQTADGEVKACLRDLSPKGALVECARVPAVGSHVIFTRGPIAIPARVAWTGERRLGLEFVEAVDEHKVMEPVFGQARPRRRACPDGPPLPPPGSEVTLLYGETALPARVIWAEDGRIALEL